MRARPSLDVPRIWPTCHFSNKPCPCKESSTGRGEQVEVSDPELLGERDRRGRSIPRPAELKPVTVRAARRLTSRARAGASRCSWRSVSKTNRSNAGKSSRSGVLHPRFPPSCPSSPRDGGFGSWRQDGFDARGLRQLSPIETAFNHEGLEGHEGTPAGDCGGPLEVA